MIEGVWRFAWRGQEHANLEAIIDQVQRYTWRPYSSEFRHALRGHDEAAMERQFGHHDRAEIGGLVSGGAWEGHQVLRLYSSVS